MSLLHLDQQLCFLLYAASRRMTALYRPLLRDLGLTYPQYLVMLVLWEDAVGEGVPVSHICRRLKLDTGTVTPLLKRLAEMGLIVRQREADDERRVLISLTTAGKDLRVRAEAVPRQLLCATGADPEMVSKWRDELRQLLAVLERESGSAGG